MKRTRRLLLTALIVCLMLLMPMTAFAKSKKAKAALAAYNSMLSQSKINVVPYNTYFEDEERSLYFCWAENVSFCTGYFNNDKIPELFLKGHASNGTCDCAAIFTYRKGSVVRLTYKDNYGAPYSSIKSYCRKRKVFRCNVHGTPHVLRYHKGKIKPLWFAWEGLSKKTIRKYTKGRKFTKIKWHLNTYANRYRYL